jgi:hypothetical protein
MIGFGLNKTKFIKLIQLLKRIVERIFANLEAYQYLLIEILVYLMWSYKAFWHFNFLVTTITETLVGHNRYCKPRYQPGCFLAQSSI